AGDRGCQPDGLARHPGHVGDDRPVPRAQARKAAVHARHARTRRGVPFAVEQPRRSLRGARRGDRVREPQLRQQGAGEALEGVARSGARTRAAGGVDAGHAGECGVADEGRRAQAPGRREPRAPVGTAAETGHALTGPWYRPAMRLGQDVLGDLSASLAREWLLSNGVGGSSSGTVAGASALRAHAWLASGTDGMPRALLLGTAERVRTAAGAFDLAGPASPARPGGPLTPESFALDPFPVWTWNVGGARIERSLFLVTGHDAVAIRYRHVEGPGVTLTVSPLVVSRPLGELQAQDPGFRGASQAVPGRIRIELPEQRSLTLFHNGAFLPARVWRPVEHALEREPVREDVCVPGYVESTLADGSSLMLVASTREDLFRALAAEDRLGSPPPRTLADCCARLEHHEREERSRWLEAALIGADLTAHQARVAHTPAESMPAERTTLIDRADGWTAALAEVLMAGLRRRGGRLTLVSSLPGAGESGVDA